MQIKSEKEKLNKIFKDIPEDKKKLVEGLIQNAAFMRVELEKLQSEIVNGEMMTEIINGNGKPTLKENPAYKAYTTMIGRYSSVIDQLGKLLPDAKAEAYSKAGDALTAFIKAGK